MGESDDLTVLPLIAGQGRNYRLTRAAPGGAAGGRRRRGSAKTDDAQRDAEYLNGYPPLPEDAHPTKFSLGDIGLGAVWTERLTDGEGLMGGLGMHVPSHAHHAVPVPCEGRHDRHSANYFHLEPTLILGGALGGGGDLGRFTWVLNQGAIILAGPDGDFSTEHVAVPTIYLSDAHYGMAWAPWSFLRRIGRGGHDNPARPCRQLRHRPQKFNDVRAVWVAPALQVHVGNTRIDLVARIGASRGQEFYGALECVGTRSVTVRVTTMFDDFVRRAPGGDSLSRMVARPSIALLVLLVSAAMGCKAEVKPGCGQATPALSRSASRRPLCLPPPQANELGIGKPCTMCGNECAAPLRCACDSLLGVSSPACPASARCCSSRSRDRPTLARTRGRAGAAAARPAATP